MSKMTETNCSGQCNALSHPYFILMCNSTAVRILLQQINPKKHLKSSTTLTLFAIIMKTDFEAVVRCAMLLGYTSK